MQTEKQYKGVEFGDHGKILRLTIFLKNRLIFSYNLDSV